MRASFQLPLRMRFMSRRIQRFRAGLNHTQNQRNHEPVHGVVGDLVVDKGAEPLVVHVDPLALPLSHLVADHAGVAPVADDDARDRVAAHVVALDQPHAS